MSTKKRLKPSLSLSHLLAIVAISIGVIGAVYLGWHESQTRISISVPVRELPAYHQIQPSDLTKKTYTARNLPSKTFKQPQDIVGRYTLTNIPKQKPLTDKQLSSKIDPARLTDTIAVGISATPAMTLGGNLQAGDIVDITLVPVTTKTGSSPSPILFPNILVLDVKLVSQANSSSTSVVIIALPLKRQQEFANKSFGATLLLTRKL